MAGLDMDASYPLPGEGNGTAPVDDYPEWLANATDGPVFNATNITLGNLTSFGFSVQDDDMLLLQIQVVVLLLTSFLQSLSLVLDKLTAEGKPMEGVTIPPKMLGHFATSFVWAEAQLDTQMHSVMGILALYFCSKSENGANFGLPSFLSPQFMFTATVFAAVITQVLGFFQGDFQAVLIVLLAHRMIQHFVWARLAKKFLGVSIVDEEDLGPPAVVANTAASKKEDKKKSSEQNKKVAAGIEQMGKKKR